MKVLPPKIEMFYASLLLKRAWLPSVAPHAAALVTHAYSQAVAHVRDAAGRRTPVIETLKILLAFQQLVAHSFSTSAQICCQEDLSLSSWQAAQQCTTWLCYVPDMSYME
jgi:hypothetical protein